MADPVRQQRADGRGRRTLFADRRTLLWLLRWWARSIFCIARRGSVGLADGRGGRTGCRCRGRRLACGQISRWKRRTIYLTCNSARDIRRHQCVGGGGGRRGGRGRGGGLACVKFSGGKRRTSLLTCNSARDIRRHQWVAVAGGVW